MRDIYNFQIAKWRFSLKKKIPKLIIAVDIIAVANSWDFPINYDAEIAVL